jgi:glyoxylase-like metal-dependent hydrolase (beta-lactamase superfamily II)
MEIKQFEDKSLAHYSYAIISDGKMALVDPARDPAPYYAFAEQMNAKIVVVIETHPHADFVSSHLEIHEDTGAKIYVSKLLGAEYIHETFDDGDAIVLGRSTLKSINTPGHSPDSISILVIDENERQQAVFTGDTLFIGDCGRPDLREKAGAITAAREELAKQMYHSLREKLLLLDDHVKVYPAHGAGSLCGKGLSDQNVSTIEIEKMTNWSLQAMSEQQFVKELTSDQPFIPKYFPYDVGINKKGAEKYSKSIKSIELKTELSTAEIEKLLEPGVVVIDSRSEDKFKRAHLPGAINLMDDTKFETWLGAIVSPEEVFYLIGSDEGSLRKLIARVAKIGYERRG